MPQLLNATTKLQLFFDKCKFFPYYAVKKWILLLCVDFVNYDFPFARIFASIFYAVLIVHFGDMFIAMSSCNFYRKKVLDKSDLVFECISHIWLISD